MSKRTHFLRTLCIFTEYSQLFFFFKWVGLKIFSVSETNNFYVHQGKNLHLISLKKTEHFIIITKHLNSKYFFSERAFASNYFLKCDLIHSLGKLNIWKIHLAKNSLIHFHLQKPVSRNKNFGLKSIPIIIELNAKFWIWFCFQTLW